MSNSMTLWTAAPQAPLSMGFSRQEYWSGLPFPPPRDLPNPGIELVSQHLLHWQVDYLPLEPPTTWEAPTWEYYIILFGCYPLFAFSLPCVIHIFHVRFIYKGWNISFHVKEKLRVCQLWPWSFDALRGILQVSPFNMKISTRMVMRFTESVS